MLTKVIIAFAALILTGCATTSPGPEQINSHLSKERFMERITAEQQQQWNIEGRPSAGYVGYMKFRSYRSR